MAQRSDGVKREVVTLVALAVLVDAVFIGGYFAAGLVRASAGLKLGYAALWTLVTMGVVLRGLLRIRAIRGGPRA